MCFFSVVIHLFVYFQRFSITMTNKRMYSQSLSFFNDHCFYRATLCVSAVFAVVRCLFVCLSVRLSFTLVHCIHMAEDIVKLLYRPSSPIILVFLTPSAGTQFQWELLQQGAKYKGGFCDFRLKSLSRKRYEIGQ